MKRCAILRRVGNIGVVIAFSAVIGGVCVGVIAGGTGERAWAHNYLVSSTPGANTTVTEQPSQFVITTNDNVLDFGANKGNTIQISGPATAPRFYGDGCVRASGASATTTAQLGQPGQYTVSWQVVSTDGHPVSGSYTFEWAPAKGGELASGADTAPTCGGAVSSTSSANAPEGQSGAASANNIIPTLLWVGGGLVVVVAAILVTLFILRRVARRSGSGSGSNKST